jgi:toxin ParE1/3/4
MTGSSNALRNAARRDFVLHPEATRDIREIWEFIAQDNPSAAGRVREEILETVRKLTAFPKQGHTRPDLTSRPLRFHNVRNYLIAHAPDDAPLLVIRSRLWRPQSANQWRYAALARVRLPPQTVGLSAAQLA